uniref:THIF-type NAD/FAD binding fold domain-containing protein n=1 Tax=Neobodo designis TaxID=312471 RepID=A0A6U4PDD1_NEODS|mmetsp:Transcript_13748/g.42800  ORF Transcript_13748/g.42800 Transcript_13748/m.42800 type:complete len:296 (+) Transcript_13748:47-934(+)
MEHQRRNGAIYERTAILLGDAGIVALQRANVLLVGVGGVGGHCAEALVRAGVGAITLCDHDVVSATNKNRQLIALDSTVGQAKVERLAARLADVNAQCHITAIDFFVTPEDMPSLLRRDAFTHVVDCIDSVECKTALLEAAVKFGFPTFMSGGAGGRLDPTLVKEGDLYETEGDALARMCRAELRKRGVGYGYIRAVYSVEKPLPPLAPVKQESGGRDRGINGTISYMPSLFGLHLAGMVVRHAVDPAAAEAKMAKSRKKRAAQERSDEERKKRDAAAKARRAGEGAGPPAEPPS